MRDQILECDGTESRLFRKYLKQITGCKAILLNYTDRRPCLCCRFGAADGVFLPRRRL